MLPTQLLVLSFIMKLFSRINIFNNIREKHGNETVRLCRQLEKSITKRAKIKLDLDFLLKCKKENQMRKLTNYQNGQDFFRLWVCSINTLLLARVNLSNNPKSFSPHLSIDILYEQFTIFQDMLSNYQQLQNYGFPLEDTSKHKKTFNSLLTFMSYAC